jgi:ubiquinone/menaquinone biosynthesis C-methylase UbiE
MAQKSDPYTSSVVGAPQADWLAKMKEKDRDYLSKAYSLSTPAEARDLYDEWADSYDQDLDELDYAFPSNAANALVNALGNDREIADLKILDAGCGTGLVGAILASEHGAKHIDGVDISSGMLKVARKTLAYQDLSEADLTKRIDREDGTYDAVICVGTLTEGHVGPAVLDEFVRVVKKGGIVDATVLEKIWTSHGFSDKVEELRSSGKVEVLSDSSVGLTKGKSTGGILVLLRKM